MRRQISWVVAALCVALLCVSSAFADDESLTIASGAAPPPPPPGCAQVVNESGSVAQGAIDRYGPYDVAEGSEFSVAMTGSGDPDLYVRFNMAPTLNEYVCRPYLTGPNETCQLTVPANASSAHVMVRGYQAGSYQLTVEHTP